MKKIKNPFPFMFACLACDNRFQAWRTWETLNLKRHGMFTKALRVAELKRLTTFKI